MGFARLVRTASSRICRSIVALRLKADYSELCRMSGQAKFEKFL